MNDSFLVTFFVGVTNGKQDWVVGISSNWKDKLEDANKDSMVAAKDFVTLQFNVLLFEGWLIVRVAENLNV